MRTRLILAAFLVLAVLPATALACSIAVEGPLQPDVQLQDLRFRRVHEGVRGAWVRDTSWVVRPVYIDQQVQLRGMRRVVSAAWAQQQTFPVTIFLAGAGRYYDPPDDGVTCELEGQLVWSLPKLLVHETDRAIFMTSVNRRTKGSTAGCGVVTGSCDDLAFRRVRLDAPIGTRQIYFVRFA